jgi:hypothetical protein
LEPHVNGLLERRKEGRKKERKKERKYETLGCNARKVDSELFSSETTL